MSPLLSWYYLVALAGWLTFPLTFRLFPALADRGYTLTRALGLILWGYIFWLLATLGVAQNDTGGLLLGLAVVSGLSVWAFMITNHRPQTDDETVDGQSSVVEWVKENKKLIVTTEILFIVTFGIFAFFRSANPEILGTEKPMELMFINGIMNSPTFPPRDLWLSGYSISYYYFGYVITAMLAKLTNVPATMAFNLMLSLIFGLGAVGAYGVLYNLQPAIENRKSAIVNSLLAPLFLLLISNVEGFLEVLHARGLFWKEGTNFWTWLDILELKDMPPAIPAWAPQRSGWWWWRASRVIMDYDFKNHWTGDVINEFPAFSFILGDLHPHVLAIPFFLLAIAIALNLFLGGFRGKIDLYIGQLHISKTGFFIAAFMLGGTAFLNTWDILPVAALIVFSYGLARVRESGWGWERIEDVLLFGIPVLVTAYVMYLPFFIGFDSQAGGIIPSFMYITRGAQLWVMWGTLLIPIFALLFYFVQTRSHANWKKGVGLSLGFVAFLTLTMLVLGFAAYKLKPELILPILDSQQMTAGMFISASFTRRLTYIGSLLTLLALLIPSLSFLFANKDEDDNEGSFITHHSSFVLLLIVLGTLLILGPDFFYLRDNFGYRINTIFKFYYQAWILLSIAAAYGTAVLLRNERKVEWAKLEVESEASHRRPNVFFSIIFVLILIIGLTYPVFGFYNRASNLKPLFGFTLDDFERIQRENPDEAAAILFLRSAPDGVIVEATGNPYSSIGRISIYTGLPTILGWGNHEGQWHGPDFQGILAQRRQDVETLYATPDWQTAQSILEQYNVRYVIVGNLEHTTHRVNEEKFGNFLKLVFQQGSISIYEVP